MKKIKKISQRELPLYTTPLSAEELAIIIGGNRAERGLYGLNFYDDESNYCGFISYETLYSSGGADFDVSSVLGTPWQGFSLGSVLEGVNNYNIGSSYESVSVLSRLSENTYAFLNKHNIGLSENGPNDHGENGENDANSHYNMYENVIYYNKDISYAALAHEIVHAYQNCMNMQIDSLIQNDEGAKYYVDGAFEFQGYTIQRILEYSDAVIATSNPEKVLGNVFKWIADCYDKETGCIIMDKFLNGAGGSDSMENRISDYLEKKPATYRYKEYDYNEIMAYQFHWKEVFDLVGIRYQ